MSPFGIGADHQTSLQPKRWLPQMAAIGIHEVRTAYPDQLDYFASLNLRPGCLLLGRPPGDTLDANGTLPVKDLPAWIAMVTKLVQGAAGRVKYWEVWNEPPNGIGRDQTAADYAKLVIATYDTAHAIDPTCLVGMEAKSTDVNWLYQTIRAGAKGHFDYIVLHPYESLGTVLKHPGAEPVFLNIVATVRKMLAAEDPAKTNVPIIFTELGSDAGKGDIHADRQAYALVKSYAMGIAQGVACIEWFEGMDGDSGPMGLLHADGKPRPSYTAMAQMIQCLGQHPVYLGWVQFNDKDWGFVFQGASKPVLITWAPIGETDKVDFGQPVTVINPLTGATEQADTYTLTTAPIIVTDVPAPIREQAINNKAKPFPWGGDYTGAKSVSVTYGVTNVEKGLHTQSAASVAADVITYGGSARSGSVPGGTVFMVDPNFLTYTSTPIEISVVVRRDAANHNAGFKLNYESTSGYKNTSGYTVPDGAGWHTATWKINDAQFVSKWGFSFSLPSDGAHNKYDIQSVTVTKLAQ